MHVSLEKFFNDISPELLETADDMLQNGQLVSLTKTEEDWYCGEVAEGSQEYQVGFKISPEGFISNLRCDCPDQQHVCKHIALLANVLQENSLDYRLSSREKGWEALIKNSDRKKLEALVLDFGRRQTDFRNFAKLKLQKAGEEIISDQIPYYRQQIGEIYDRYKNKGYIDYQASFRVSEELNQYEKLAYDFLGSGHWNEVFCISAAIVMEGITAMEGIDDSSGNCGMGIEMALEDIGKILEKTKSKNLRKKVGLWLYDQLQDSAYGNYGCFDDQMYALYQKVVTEFGEDEIEKQYLDYKIGQLKENAHSQNSKELY